MYKPGGFSYPVLRLSAQRQQSMMLLKNGITVRMKNPAGILNRQKNESHRSIFQRFNSEIMHIKGFIYYTKINQSRSVHLEMYSNWLM